MKTPTERRMNPSSQPAHLARLAVGEPHLLEDRGFWALCVRRNLRFQRSIDCGTWRHPPAPSCAVCHSPGAAWELAPGGAELFSFTVVHHPVAPALVDAVPYNVAIVAFPVSGTLRLVSTVIDVPVEALRIGMPLELAWARSGDDRM